MNSVLTAAELEYLHGQRRLGRVATVGRDGTPHVVPGGWTHNVELDTIAVTGRDLERRKKLKHVARSGRAAIVIDDIASVNPFGPRAIEVRGRAEAIPGPDALIRMYPERIVSWGVDAQRNARTVARAADGAAEGRADGWSTHKPCGDTARVLVIGATGDAPTVEDTLGRYLKDRELAP